MAQTNVSLRIDEDVKKDAEAIFSQLGLTLSAATNVFYRQAIRTRGIPFYLTTIDENPEKQGRKKTFSDISKPLMSTKDWTFDREEANERR